MSLTIPQLLSGLRAKGVSLSLSNGAISLKGTVEALMAADRENLQTRDTDIILYLGAHAATAAPSLKPSGINPRPAQSQLAWWHWVTESPFPLPIERIAMVRTFPGSSQNAVAAIEQIVTRHDTLRSSFSEKDGELVIALNPAQDFIVETEGPVSGEDTALARAQEFVRGALPTKGKWLVKAKVIDWAGPDVVVALLLSHLVVDGISIDLLRGDLEEILSGAAKAERPPQFTDYAEWEHDWIAGDAGRALIDYWANWLGDQVPLRAPQSGRPLEWQHGRNVDYHFELASAPRSKLYGVAAELKTTPFFLYLSLYAMALSRWSGQARFALRCIGDLRRSRQLAPVVGYMTCADPIEVQIKRGDDFAAVLKFITAEYYNAAMLRLPSMLKFPAHPARPGIEKEKFSEAIAATINYMPDRRRPGAAADESGPDNSAWPPAVTRDAVQEWPALLWPIYLRLYDIGGKTKGLLQFNDAIITAQEQEDLLSCFFDVIAEVTAG